MSSLNSIYIKLETLETLAKTVKAKGEKGISLTISINDETNNYGQNISGYVEQSKEAREAKKPKFYIGNGKTFWTNGVITVATPKDKTGNTTEAPKDDDLPF